MGIKTINDSDLQEVVRIHQKAFKGFLMTLLGQKFLYEYYHLVLSYPNNISLIYETDGSYILGFAVGYMDPAGFYSELKRKKIKLILSVLIHIGSRPRLWKRILDSYRYADINSSAINIEKNTAELASIAVDPDGQNKGVGRELLSAFINEAKKRNASKVVLTTDAEDNEHVNKFYRKAGFSIQRAFYKSKGRKVNEYVYHLNQGESEDK
ncbi:MAG: GNAT family N-acetyltransferase [Candidatus Aminicenantales bacterium]